MCKNNLLQIRLTKKQKSELALMAEVEGYSSISEYCRCKLLDSLSIHSKLDKILKRLCKNV
jgi:hypothetical protein